MSDRDKIPPAVLVQSFIKTAGEQGVATTVIYGYREGNRSVLRLKSSADSKAVRDLLKMVLAMPEMQLDEEPVSTDPPESTDN